MPDGIITLANARTTTGTDGIVTSGCHGRHVTFSATVAGTGTVTATVIVQGSHDGTNWFPIDTITLSGTTSATDGCYERPSAPNLRANVTAISGTSAAVTCTMAVA